MLFAALVTEDVLQTLASAAMGASAGVFVWWVLRVLWSEDLKQGAE